MCNSLGKRIKNLREDRLKNDSKHKWSLDALAKRINVSSQSLSKIETGKTNNPNMAIIKSLAIEFGVSADYLIFGHDTNTKIIVQINGDPRYLRNINTIIKITSDD